jgi:predicted RNA-binding Zn ribbon-like protein
MAIQAETLRKVIENLVDAKLVDAMARPDGLNRLLAHRRTGVASPDIRNAERKLEETLGEMLGGSSFQHDHEEQLA